MTEQKRKILFVRSGGGMPGLDIHAGIWTALNDCGIVSTHNAGTSAGAVVSALDSAGRDPRWFWETLQRVSDADVRSERLFWKMRVPWIDHFLSFEPIIYLLCQVLQLPRHFGDLAKPCDVYATSEESGLSVHMQFYEDLVPSILASIAICGVFRPVQVGPDLVCSDGGTTANLPLPEDWRRFDEIWLLIAKRPLDYQRRRNNVISRLLYNCDLWAEDQIRDVLDAVAGHRVEPGKPVPAKAPRVFVVRPQVRTPRGSLRFAHGLIAESYDQAMDQIRAQTRAVRGATVETQCVEVDHARENQSGHRARHPGR